MTAPDTRQLRDESQSAHRQSRAVLVVAVAVVLGCMVIMAGLGVHVFLWKTAIIPILLIVALASRRFNRFADDWAVFLALVILFDFLRGFVFTLICRVELPVHMRYVIDWERCLCAGSALPIILQNLSARLGSPDWLDGLATVAHGSHFAFFLFFGLAVWVLRPGEFWRYACAITLILYAGVAVYLIVPTVPPWMAADPYAAIPHVEHISYHIYNLHVPTLQEGLDTNPIAAMPSLHAALPTLCTLMGFYHFGLRVWPLAVYTALIFFAVGYLGDHYLVDIAAGVVLALVSFIIVYRLDLLARWHRRRRWRFRPMIVASVLIVLTYVVGHVNVMLQEPLSFDHDHLPVPVR